MSSIDYYETESCKEISIKLNEKCCYSIEMVEDKLCVCFKISDRIATHTSLNSVNFFMKQIKALEKIICITIPEREMLIELGRYDVLLNKEKRKLNKLRKENDIKVENIVIDRKIKETPLLNLYNLKTDIKRLIDGEINRVNIDTMYERINEISNYLFKFIKSVEPRIIGM